MYLELSDDAAIGGKAKMMPPCLTSGVIRKIAPCEPAVVANKRATVGRSFSCGAESPSLWLLPLSWPTIEGSSRRLVLSLDVVCRPYWPRQQLEADRLRLTRHEGYALTLGVNQVEEIRIIES